MCITCNKKKRKKKQKKKDGETVNEFCSALKTLAKNSDLGDKEESWITSMLVLGLKDPSSKERLMEREQSLEKTLQAARIAETSKQHMKSIKEEGSKVEKVDVVDGKGQKPQWGMPCRSCGIRHARDSCPAAGRRCHKCQKMNHFSRMCRTPDTQKKQRGLVEDVISDHQLARFAEATKEDAILSDLQQVILSGWPDSKCQVPPNAQEFWNYRDELTVAQGLIVKGQKIVVPSSLRGEMLEKLMRDTWVSTRQ